jgi:hypothetical protein
VRFLRSREDAITFALLVQVAAFLIGPALHLVNHRPDHTHGPGGVTHSHQHAPAGQTPAHDGHGSAQHFGLALTAPQIFLWALVVALALSPGLSFPTARGHARLLFDCAAPRGPPVLT